MGITTNTTFRLLARVCVAVLSGLAVALTMIATPAGAGEADGNSAEERKLANAWVPAQEELSFGAVPLEHVRDAAASAADQAACSISADTATALVLAVTWPEVAPSGAAPSPMTLSRYDTQSSLGDPQDRAPGLWFHPGIGMWQLDSAGLGTDFTAGQAMDSRRAADFVAPHMVDRFCTSRNGGASAADARADAWQAWVACRQGACEDTYQRALSGVTEVDGVGRHGGADVRRCWYQGAGHDCVFVDPDNAQGADWWAAPGGGQSPIAAPFYVIELDGSTPTELRYWLAEDSGADTDVQARRPFGANARGGLTWATGPGLCDLDLQRGDC